MRRTAKRDEAAMRAFVEQMARILADWGLPRMASRVLFVLMSADEEALTAGELAERLDVSPAAISGAVRYLIQISMVAREPVPGSRRDRYRLVDDSWYEVTLAKMTLIKTLADFADQGVAAAGGPEHRPALGWPTCGTSTSSSRRRLPDLLDKWADRKRTLSPS